MITFKSVTIQQTVLRCLRQAVIFAVLLPAIVLVALPTAIAQGPGEGEAVTIEMAQCMQEVTPFALGCTANDIQVAGVATDANGDPLLTILDDGCAFPGDMVTFEAVFDVVTTAKRRHDIGIYFATDGDPNGDGALTSGDGITGQNIGCSVSTMPYAPDLPWLDLDGTDDDPDGVLQDTCGDIDKPNHNPLQPLLTIKAVCVDFDGNGTLNLPNCTSWRQAGSNELCESPLDTFPGSPSKCRCDEGFEVPIDVPVVDLTVLKTANPTSIDEPGGDVTFTVDITNPSPFASVTLTSVADDETNDGTDDLFLDILNNCDDDANAGTPFSGVLPPGGSATCTFMRPVSGNAGDVIEDEVTVDGTDSEGAAVMGSDTATVTILDVPSSIMTTKTAVCSSNCVDITNMPTEAFEPGGDFDYAVVVTNTSAVDTVTINTVIDDQFGDVSASCAPALPADLAPNATTTCSFTETVSGNAGLTHMNTATASGVDDDGNSLTADGSAVVTLVDVPSFITVSKSPSPTSLDEPGGDVTYTVVVTNVSTVDTVTITSVIDDQFGDVGASCVPALPADLAPNGGTTTCTFIEAISGNAGDTHTNMVTASGVDNDGNTPSASATADVPINGVNPAATLTKTVFKTVVTYEVDIANDSVSSDPLTLTHLEDDIYGNLLVPNINVDNNTCQSLFGTMIQPGDSISCSFDATNNSPGGTLTDIVTGQLDDDEDVPVAPDPSDSATITVIQ